MEELLGVNIPDGEYDTLAGFILSELGHIPDASAHETVEADNVVFTVTEMEDLRIVTVHAEITPKPDNDNEQKKRKDDDNLNKKAIFINCIANLARIRTFWFVHSLIALLLHSIGFLFV